MFESIDASEVKFLAITRVNGAWYLRAYLPYQWEGKNLKLEGLLQEYNDFIAKKDAEPKVEAIAVAPTEPPPAPPVEAAVENPPPAVVEGGVTEAAAEEAPEAAREEQAISPGDVGEIPPELLFL